MLWRVDSGPNREDLYIVSPERPDLTGFVEDAGWPTTETWRTREYSPRIQSVRTGERWQFRLTANPSYYKSIHPGKRPQRVAHVTVEQQLDWLKGKSLAHGFTIGDSSTDGTPQLGAAVTNRRDVRFSKNAEPGSSSSKHVVTLRTAQFDGVLQITDATEFRKTLSQGVGPSKGYGCGLLTIAPLTLLADTE